MHDLQRIGSKSFKVKVVELNVNSNSLRTVTVLNFLRGVLFSQLSIMLDRIDYMFANHKQFVIVLNSIISLGICIYYL